MRSIIKEEDREFGLGSKTNIGFYFKEEVKDNMRSVNVGRDGKFDWKSGIKRGAKDIGRLVEFSDIKEELLVF